MEGDIKKVMESLKAQEEALETRLQQDPDYREIKLKFKKMKERDLKAKNEELEAKIKYIHSLLNSL